MQKALKTVTPIGSCRIVGPIKRSSAQHGFILNRTRSYGYCHTSLEAVQQVRFLQEAYRPSEQAWSMMAANVDYRTIRDEKHYVSDTYVIEISSQKQLTWHGHAIQLNYLNRRCERFFACSSRSNDYWAAVDDCIAGEWLDQNWPGTECRADRRLLADIERSFATQQSLTQHLNELCDRLPSVTIVTHVDAILPNGEPIASRSKFINMVEAVCNENQVAVYNPTTLASLYGQGQALEPESNSYTHYTANFETVLALDLLDHIVNANDLGIEIDLPGKLPHVVTQTLDALRRDRRSLFKEAVLIAEKIVECAPSAAKCRWLADVSFRARSTEPISNEIVSLIRTYAGIDTAYRICRDNASRARLRRAVETSDIPKLLRAMSDVDGIQTTLSAAIGFKSRFERDTDVQTEVTKLVLSWSAHIMSLGTNDAQLSCLCKLNELAPGNKTINQELKRAMRNLLREARDAFGTRNVARLKTIWERVHAHGLKIREVDVLWARLSFEIGDFLTAHCVADGLVKDHTTHLTSWIILMRSAAKVGDQEQSMDAAKQVEVLSENTSPKHAEEARILTQKLKDAA